MKDKTPIFIVLFLIIIIGLVFSPAKKGIEKQKEERRVSSSVGKKEEIKSSSTTSGFTPNKVIAKDIKEAEEQIKRLEENIAKADTPGKKSPYADKIRMSNLAGARSNDPSKQYVTLSTRLGKTETVNITGWYLKSEVTGYYAMIGKASLLPFPFTKSENDIVLQQGDRAVLVKGFSPIGISFRTNICTGFFEENRTFTPSLPLRCPLPEDEVLPKFSNDLDRNDECIKIIERIPRCVTKGNEFVRDLADTVPESCKTYIRTQINYNSCVARHFSDTSFPGNEYRVYLNKFGTLWRTDKEKISLYDQNGLVVDTISY